MAKLTADEFFKLPSAKRPDRKLKLIEAIEGNKALSVIISGKETSMVFPSKTNTNALRQIRALQIGDNNAFNAIKLKGSDNKDYKISSIVKSDYFGGGGGSRGGSDLTSITESGQCYVTSIVYNIKKRAIKWEDLTLEDLTKAAKYVDTGSTTLEEVLEQTPPEWVRSYVKVANYLFENYKMKPGKTVYFHRDSALHKKIFKFKKAVMDADSASDNPQAPGSFADDKWNPGDIWMTTYGLNAYDLPEFPTDSWSKLNEKIYELSGKGQTTNRELLGVSLKKIERNPRSDEYNKPGLKKDSYSFSGFTVSPERLKIGEIPFFSSIDCYLYIGDGKVQFRATSGIASKPAWQGEISGTTAAGGKVGGRNVNMYLKENFGDSIFKLGEGECVSKINNPAFWKEFYGYYCKLFDDANYKRYNKQPLTGAKVSFEDFKKLCQERAKKTETYIVSKYMCMKMIDVIMNNTRNLNQFSTDIFLYGSSNTNQSSYFIKIYE